jgi:hypothetical protein
MIRMLLSHDDQLSRCERGAEPRIGRVIKNTGTHLLGNVCVEGRIDDVGLAACKASAALHTRVDAPKVDATRQNCLSIGRRRFLSSRSLRGHLPLAKCLTAIR